MFLWHPMMSVFSPGFITLSLNQSPWWQKSLVHWINAPMTKSRFLEDKTDWNIFLRANIVRQKSRSGWVHGAILFPTYTCAHNLSDRYQGKENSHILWLKLPSDIQKIREIRLRHVSMDREKRQRHVNADPFTKWNTRKTEASLSTESLLSALFDVLSMIPFS